MKTTQKIEFSLIIINSIVESSSIYIFANRNAQIFKDLCMEDKAQVDIHTNTLIHLAKEVKDPK